MSKSGELTYLAVFVLVCLGIGFLGSMATAPNVKGWYSEIAKPSWNPPNSVFGPVWTILYISMGIAAWLVWKKTGSLASGAMIIFFVQLFLNLIWSWLFFGMKNPLLGFVDIILLWLAIIATIVSFWKVSPVAGIIMIPYLLWVSFASALNFTIWRLN